MAWKLLFPDSCRCGSCGSGGGGGEAAAAERGAQWACRAEQLRPPRASSHGWAWHWLAFQFPGGSLVVPWWPSCSLGAPTSASLLTQPPGGAPQDLRPPTTPTPPCSGQVAGAPGGLGWLGSTSTAGADVVADGAGVGSAEEVFCASRISATLVSCNVISPAALGKHNTGQVRG